VALGVRINTDGSTLSAGGMMIQMLPDGDQEAVDALELLLDKMTPISSLVEEEVKRSNGKTEEAIMTGLLQTIFADLPEKFAVETLEFRELKWDCDCSAERLEKVLISIGPGDLKEIIEEDGQAELVCQFCEKKYHFDKEHLEQLLKESLGIGG